MSVLISPSKSLISSRWSHFSLFIACSHSMSNHSKFELTTFNQRPDSVLKQLKMNNGGAAAATPLGPKRSSRIVKVAVWALSAGIGAAALAVLNTASEFWQ